MVVSEELLKKDGTNMEHYLEHSYFGYAFVLPCSFEKAEKNKDIKHAVVQVFIIWL